MITLTVAATDQTSTFNFNSGYFNAAYLNNLPVTATGSLNGTQKYSTTFTVGQAGDSRNGKLNQMGLAEHLGVADGT